MTEDYYINSCGAWCFVLGAALAAFCVLEGNHDGDHKTEIAVYSEPKSKFTIYWSLIKDEPDNQPVVQVTPEDSLWAYESTPIC